MDKRKPTQIADVGEQDDREHNDPEYTYTCLTHRYIDESKQGPRDYVWAGNCDFAWNTRTRRSTIDSTPTIHFSRWSFVRINSPKDHMITHTHPLLPLHPFSFIIIPNLTSSFSLIYNISSQIFAIRASVCLLFPPLGSKQSQKIWERTN